ncbi:MAG: phosphate ABC transporter substrate-binding protein PstS [Epsilonproteobacteria bacterium]|nr:phosphate ABC transporter substrate-binding protein PstS [Campylobacterota bacterium]
MKKIITVALAGAFCTASLMAAGMVKGDGSSFVLPINQAWAKAYYKATGKQVQYNGGGSGKGIKDATARLVDFGGTDAPLTPRRQASKKMLQFPAVVGATVMAYNLPNIKSEALKLTDKAIVAIADGRVKFWDDDMLKAVNPNIKLPHKKIIFARRSDASGTTWNFTYFLSSVSLEWRKKFGVKKTINWTSNNLGGKGNPGVSSIIKQTPYSIGYIEYAYAVESNAKVAVIENRDGYFVKPEMKTFQAAAAGADFDPKKGFYTVIGYPKGKDSYPLVAAPFIIMPKEKIAADKQITAFYAWAYDNGAKIAEKLFYVPLPKSVTDKIKQYWKDNGVY